jgi:hypothetical protein
MEVAGLGRLPDAPDADTVEAVLQGPPTSPTMCWRR